MTPSSPNDPTSLPEDHSAHRAKLHIWQIQVVRDLLLVAVVIAIFWFGYALRAVTVPLLVALLLAYLCEPIISRLAAVSWIGRVRAVTGLLAAGILLALLVAAIALPLIITQTLSFTEEVVDGRMRTRMERAEGRVPEAVLEPFQRFVALLPAARHVAAFEDDGPAESDDGADAGPDEEDSAEVVPPGSVAAMDEQAVRHLVDERVRELLAEGAVVPVQTPAAETDWLAVVKRASSAITMVIGGLVRIGLLIFLIPFYFWFFSVWYPDIRDFGLRLIPDDRRERWLDLLGKMDRVVAGFVRGRILISVLMGCMFAIGWFFCGVPYAVPVGLITGVFCAVPYLGIVGLPVAIGLLFLDQAGSRGEMVWWAIILWPSLVFTAVQMIESYFLTPTIAGKVTNLDPVTVLVVVLAGGSVMGVYGMLLAIPIAACGKILLTEVLMPRVRAWLEGRAADPLPID